MTFAPTGQRIPAQGKRIRVSGSRRPGFVLVMEICPNGAREFLPCQFPVPLQGTFQMSSFPGAALRRCHGCACPRLASRAPLGQAANYVFIIDTFFGNGVVCVWGSRFFGFSSAAGGAFSGTHNNASAISARTIRIRNVRQIRSPKPLCCRLCRRCAYSSGH